MVRPHRLLPLPSMAATMRPRSPRPRQRPKALWSKRASTPRETRSEEHTSELQSLMRISYAVFCLKKKHNITTISTLDAPHHTSYDIIKKLTLETSLQ